MKNVKLRINADHIINITGAAILFTVGLSLFIAIIFNMIECADSWIPKPESDFERAFEFITVPVMITLNIIFLIPYFITGSIPVILGLLIGALSTVARFSYTEKCTSVTKPYKTLMTIANYMTLSIFVTFAFGASLLMYILQ